VYKGDENRLKIARELIAVGIFERGPRVLLAGPRVVDRVRIAFRRRLDVDDDGIGVMCREQNIRAPAVTTAQRLHGGRCAAWCSGCGRSDGGDGDSSDGDVGEEAATKAKPVGRYDLVEDRRRPRAAPHVGLDISAGFTGSRRFLGATRAHSCVHARGPLRDARQPTAMVIRRRPFDRWAAMPTVVVLLSLVDTESLAARFLGILNLDLLFVDETSREPSSVPDKITL
ncbi:hypothetical protein ALC62_01646, partial [Cyphomyrmex costatus]